MDIMLSAYSIFNNQSDRFRNTLTNLATGKRINSASDDPSGYVSSKLLEKESRTLQTQSRVAEREIALLQTVSSRYDQAAKIVANIDELYTGISDISGDSEKQAVQNHVKELTGLLDPLMAKNAQIDTSNRDRLTSDIRTTGALHNAMLSVNASTGSQIQSLNMRQEINRMNYVNIMAQKSSIEDANMAESYINAQGAAIRMQASINMLKNAGQYTSNQFNKFF